MIQTVSLRFALPEEETEALVNPTSAADVQDQQAFIEAFRFALAAELGIDPDRITGVTLSLGSIIIDFVIEHPTPRFQRSDFSFLPLTQERSF